ncbi:M10 family metallopeptidase C-terminal domain-containing protein [Psychromarinibacter sp. S121]|uniref:M10 family metallopeptidase C-terminal domain-containing protein n=1 Tax=Psychromarinibacter sp. S121 TaxID=3415127 RepID=UPI003C7974C9
MATINVSNSSQLSAALNSATGGDTIVLQNGNYGDLTIDENFSSNVTIQAANDLGASFGVIKITGSNITLDGITSTARFTVVGATNVEVTNSYLESWVEALQGQNVSFTDNEMKTTLYIKEVNGFTVTGNEIGRDGGVDGDLMVVAGNATNGLIENNFLMDASPTLNSDGTYTHADAIQFYNQSSGWPSDIVIRGNVIWDDPSTGDPGIWLQGIAVGGTNILIEENLVMAGTPNAIIVANSSGGIEILNNTVLPWPGGGGGNIRVTNTASGVVVDGNVSNYLINDGNATVLDNYVYSTNSSAANYYKNILQVENDGMDWTDFLPVDGSVIDFGNGYGATTRLTELLNGDTGSSSDDEPDDTVVEEPVVEEPVVTEPEDDTTDAEDPDLSWDSLTASFKLEGDYEFSGGNQAMEFEHEEGLELSSASISLTFNADTVSGQHGIISKDASYFANGGHFTVYIDNGSLVIRFQDESTSEVFTVSGIQANVDYELQIGFGDGTVVAMLDGIVVGEAAFDMSWEDNSEFLQIGANGWSSSSGGSGYSQVFDGTISDIVISSGNNLSGDGEDAIVGTINADSLGGTNGADTIYGDAGNDTIDGGKGNDKLGGGDNNDHISGRSGADILDGGAGNDFLFSGVGRDIILGGDGNDSIKGGKGSDTMSGGSGADQFIFSKVNESKAANPDFILDFTVGVDTLDVSDLISDTLDVRLLERYNGDGPAIRTTEKDGNTVVRIDVDGDRSSDMRIVLADVTGLTADDFLL